MSNANLLVWDDDRTRKECVEGDLLYKEALINAGYLPKTARIPLRNATKEVSNELGIKDATRNVRLDPYQANNISDLIRIVCRKRNLLVKDLLSEKRSVRLVRARKEIARIAYFCFGRRMNAIARALNRDHTTVLYWLRNGDNDELSDFSPSVAPINKWPMASISRKENTQREGEGLVRGGQPSDTPSEGEAG